MSKANDVTDVSFDISMKPRATLSWKSHGFRWHVWFANIDRVNFDTIETGSGALRNGRPCLYKNSFAKHGEPGYFSCRHLDATKTANKQMIEQALHVMRGNNLIEKAKDAVRDKEDRRLADASVEASIYRKRVAGPVMYDALKLVQKYVDESTENPGPVHLDKHHITVVIKRALHAADTGSASVD